MHCANHDLIEIIHNNNGENVVVQIKNNSEDEIEFIGASVVYYQGDKVVGIADDLETDVKSGRAANFTLHFPRNKEYRKIDFDSYKVFVTHAYTFSW